jgi:hypothetical protein
MRWQLSAVILGQSTSQKAAGPARVPGTNRVLRLARSAHPTRYLANSSQRILLDGLNTSRTLNLYHNLFLSKPSRVKILTQWWPGGNVQHNLPDITVVEDNSDVNELRAGNYCIGIIRIVRKDKHISRKSI